MGTSGDTKEWVLEPETEYRFELDPGTTLAIKVSVRVVFVETSSVINTLLCSRISYCTVKQKYLELSLAKELTIFSVLSAKLPSSPGKDVPSRYVIISYHFPL